ncbi:MAG: O-acetyl-ADP-ribose deacetylase [Thermodesulfobacteriota bacterium]
MTTEIKIGSTIIELTCGDITKEDTNAIVNAANSRLAGGGGVDGAIHSAGGPGIMAECSLLDGCPTGEAVITTAGNLRARNVIHTVGPIYKDGDQGEARLLERAYRNSLELAVSNELTSIAFPSISTGAYGYPIREAARVALRTVVDFAKKEESLTLVRFVLFSEADLKVYEGALEELTS